MLTTGGRKQLAVETEAWQKVSVATNLALGKA
jgi:hypothetical protein